MLSELVGGVEASEFGRLIGLGTVELPDRFVIQLVADFVPAVDDSFAVIDVDQITGDLANVEFVGDEIGDVRLNASIDDGLLTLLAENR